MLIQTKRNKGSRALSKFFVIGVVIFFISFAFITVKEMTNKNQLEKEIAQLNNEIETLKLKKQSFLDLIDTYQDEFYVESEARKKMNLKKPGEKVVVVNLDEYHSLDDDSVFNNQYTDEEKNNNVEKVSNFVLWWNYFFGNKTY